MEISMKKILLSLFVALSFSQNHTANHVIKQKISPYFLIDGINLSPHEIERRQKLSPKDQLQAMIKDTQVFTGDQRSLATIQQILLLNNATKNLSSPEELEKVQYFVTELKRTL